MIRRPLVLAIGAILAIAACDSDEATSHGHTPDSVKIFDGATELAAPYQLTVSQTVRWEVNLYADDGDEILLDDDHVIGLAFSPAALATAVAVAGEPEQFDVTAQAAAGSGTVTVGWGHDTPDDLTFGPFAVDVVP